MSAHLAEGGFSEPGLVSQAVFKQVMDAFARPGTIVSLAGHCTAATPLDEATTAFLLTLSDYDTPVWFEDPAAGEACATWLTFQTGAPRSVAQQAAHFAILSKTTRIEDWDGYPLGDSAYPDRSATLLLPVTSLTGGAPLVLAGPGIEGEARITISGLPQGFREARAANRARFPLGLDLVLTCGADVLALPRTTTIEEA